MTEKVNAFGYQRVVAGILRMIEKDDLQPEAKLPAIPDLQRRFKVSSTTARRAVDVLRQRGIVEGRQGSGLFLVRRPSEAEAAEAEAGDEVVSAVDALRQELRTLAERVERLEAAQPQERTPARQAARPHAKAPRVAP